MLSPDDIAQRRFLVSLRGYDRDEVTAFLADVASEVRGLRARVAELQADLQRAHEAPASTGEAPRSSFRALGEETTRILEAAEESAREIRARAAADAQELGDAAQREAREVVDRANRQATRTIAEAERRRDAIAAELASLREDRDRFVAGLRTAVRTIEDVVGTAGGERPRSPAQALEQPDEPDELLDLLLAPGSLDDAAHPADVPHLLLAAPAAEPEPAAAPASDDEAEADTPAVEKDDDTVESRRDHRLGEVRTSMARQCKRGLQEIQNEVLASIRDHGREASLEVLLPTDVELDELGARAADHLADAYDGALADAAAEVGGEVPGELRDGPRVAAAVATFRAVLAHEVNAALRATLRAGLEADEPTPQLSERVGEAFRDLRGPVIEATVDEHVQRTYGHGLLDAWAELGVDTVRWQSRPEARCPEGRCRTNAAEGTVALGEDFPSGDRVPPAHPGCTCVVVPAEHA